MNIIILTGRLTRDPETRLAKNGGVYIPFTVAVERSDKNRTADFFDCIAFGSTADFIAKYFKKGSGIELSGEMHLDKTEKDGQWTTRPSIAVKSVGFALRSNNPNETGERETGATGDATDTEEPLW